MNKKFFAALASATMAFTASGSIAVFADDFVEENTPSIDAGDLKPVAKEVKWDKETFGELVELTGDKLQVESSDLTAADGTTLEEDVTVKTADLAKVKTINFTGSNFKGEIKGLEYFTGLETFNDNGVKKLTNKALDFSASTKLKDLTVANTKDLAELTLPNADEDEVYHLENLSVTGAELPSLDVTKQEALKSLILNATQTTSLDLTESDTFTTLYLYSTKLTSLDLSKQEKLTNVVATANSNLKDVVVKNGKKGAPKAYTTLDLSDNALETVNLDHTSITTLDLSKNHIGALDLSKTTATNADLSKQTFYVSEKAANVNLTEAFPTLKTRKVEVTDPTKFDEDTGVLTLGDKETTYTYEVSLKSATEDMDVKITAANPMNRLYNPNSGEHFYTADLEEKEALVALGWNDEGYGWVAPSTDKADDKKGSPVFRLYNANAGDHHYTMDQNEVKTLVAYGWKDEGTGWYSAAKDYVDVYRQYNPYANGAGSHNYTTDKAENDYLVSLGWIYEGAAWKALK